MSRLEQIPLLSATSRKGNTRAPNRSVGDSYLLLSVPVNEEKTFVKKLDKIGNYSGLIVAVTAVVIVILLIVGITSRADISEIINSNSNKGVPNRLTASSNTQLGERNGESREINTPLGRVRGYGKRSRKGREFYAFYKVPYAKPPLGDLRFRDPQPVEKWDGVLDNLKPDCQCIQLSKHSTDGKASGEEDCLYSSIYVPVSSDTDISTLSLPTMVYVHGGGFGDGNGSRYGPEYFMDEDVVLLTFEFRVGLFGFLNTGDQEAKGNMAFKDQIMMLRWVKNYIKYFGGDSERVTIFGNSAGAFSIGFLMISPMSQGLFHRAISQSGTSLTETYSTIDLHPEITKEAVAKTFNCSLESSAELLKCLRKVDAKEIAVLDSPNITYALTVEQGFDINDMSNVFMPEKPYDRLKSGKVNRLPYIIGIGATEYVAAALGILMSESLTERVNSNFSQFAPTILNMNLTPEDADKLKEFYFGNKDIGMDTERNLTNMISDRIMVHGSKVAADFHSQFSKTYLYYNGKRPKQSYAERILKNFPDFDSSDIVSHADELQFLFPYYGYPEYPPSDPDYFPFSEFLVKLWAHFATTGNPSSLNSEMAEWKSINPNDPQVTYWFELNDQVGPTSVLLERMAFWDKEFTHKQLLYEL